MRRTRVAVVVAASAFAASTFGACGGGGGETAATPPPEETTAAEPAGDPVDTVDVSETEYELDPSDPTISKPGVVEFVVTNDGEIDHSLEVEGPTGEVETPVIAPGDSATLEADLSEPGEFTWYCPIGTHAEQGMEGTITVE